MANVTNLSVKIGIGFGKCALLYVGGIFDRSEFFTVGSALTFALESEEQATEGGQIIVSDTAFKHVKNQYYEGAEIISKTNNKFYRVTKVKESVRGRADAILIKQSIKHDKILQVQKSLRSCVPAAIIPYLEIGFERFGSENRTLTVMFASLGVDLSSASSDKGMQKIQKIVTTVQQQVYRLEGSLNKLVMDDKGSTLICIWGLCPMAHTDDPQRAILTAMNMKKALAKVENTWCNVGIATGDVFSGVVGTSGSRKEFSVLGDTVNLAARIMFWPKKFGQTGKINCDLRTKQEAMNQISFKYGGHCEFKGKSISIPIYEPIDPEEEYSYFGEQKKQHAPQMCLKLSYNPLIVQKQVNHKKFGERMIGQSTFIMEIYDEIKSFFLQNNFSSNDQRSPLSIIIQGEIGSGKTFCLRSICEKLQKDQDFNGKLQVCCQNAQIGIKPKAYSNKTKTNSIIQHQQTTMHQRLPIFATAPNVESRLKFLGAWRPILRGMLEFTKKTFHCSAIQILKKIIGTEHQDKTALILEIFGFKPLPLSQDIKDSQKYSQMYNQLNPNNVQQCKNLSLTSPVHFLIRESYANTITDNVIDIILQFIAEFLGEEGSDYLTSQQESSEGASINLSEHSKMIRIAKQKNTTMFAIFIFDNASIMDEESWSLILRVYRQCSNVCIIMAVGQDHLGNSLMPQLVKPSAVQLQGVTDVPYNRDDEITVKEFIKEASSYDMPLINKKDFETILKELAPAYQWSQIEEMRSMTSIKDPQTTIKTIEDGEMWVKRITGKLNLHRVFKTIDDGIVVHIVQKCEGNPLICLQYFYNLMSNGFIMINERDQVVPNESFQQCMKLHDFTTVPSPSPVHKRRLKNLDDYLKMGRTQNNQRKQELVIKGIMLMKAASCIGDEFGTYALKKILPLRNETHGSILQILKELESNDFVEILNESDPKNIYCRFNKNFLRESIYQVMLYRDQKQVLHQQLAEHLQSLPTSVIDQKQIEIELLRLKQNILIGEDVKDEKLLPFKQMQGLIVKQMQYLLMKQNSRLILHSGWLFKQGQKANKKVSKRLMIMTSKEISWYHDWEEYQNKQQPLGVIQIQHVYQTSETLMSANTYDFDICITEYLKKGKLEKGGTQINFGCATENERHNWISRIEFLRAKTVYENYVKKFVNIQFPLNKEEDVEEEDQQNTEEVYEKLNAFGKNLKSNAKINHSASADKEKNSQKPRPALMRAQSVIKRRMSIGTGGAINHERQSSLGEENNDQNYMSQKAAKAKDLSLKLKELYRASMISYQSHITQNCNKSSKMIKNKPIGQMPPYFKMSDQVKDKPSGCSHSHDNHHHHAPDHGPSLAFAQPKMFKTKSDDSQIKKKGAELMKSLEQFQRRASLQNDKTPDSHQSKNTESTPLDIHQIEEKSERSSSSQSRDSRPKTQQPPYKGAMRRLPTQQRMSEQLSKDKAKQVAKELKMSVKIGSRENSEENIRMTSKLDYSSSLNRYKEKDVTNSTSENKVSQQLKMIEESNFINKEERPARGFTFNRNSSEQSKDPHMFQGQEINFNPQSYNHFNDKVNLESFNEVFRRDTIMLNDNQQYNEPAFNIISGINSSNSNTNNTNFDSHKTFQRRLNNISGIRQTDSNREIFTPAQITEPHNPATSNYTPQTGEPLQIYQQPTLPMQQLEPLIQKEVNYQLNMGLKQFFENLSKKMDSQERHQQNTEEDIYNRSQDPNYPRIYQGGPQFNHYFSKSGGVSSKNNRFQAVSESMPSKQVTEGSEDDEPDDGEERDRLFHQI